MGGIGGSSCCGCPFHDDAKSDIDKRPAVPLQPNVRLSLQKKITMNQTELQHFIYILNPAGENIVRTQQFITEAHRIATTRMQRRTKTD
jgi:hypothetical protein